MACIDRTQLERVHRKSRDWEGLSLRDACLGFPRRLHSQKLMKSQVMEHVPARKIKTGMKWWSQRILSASEPRRRIEYFFCGDGHGVMNVVFFSTEFSWQSFWWFRTHVVATTVCTYTHLVHALFLLHSLSAHIRTSSCVCTYTHGSSVWKGLLHAHVVDLHLAFSLLMFHPSLLFLDGHFETIPDLNVYTFLPFLPVLKAQGMRISARAARSLAIWPSPLSTQSWLRFLAMSLIRRLFLFRTLISDWCAARKKGKNECGSSARPSRQCSDGQKQDRAAKVCLSMRYRSTPGTGRVRLQKERRRRKEKVGQDRHPHPSQTPGNHLSPITPAATVPLRRCISWQPNGNTSLFVCVCFIRSCAVRPSLPIKFLTNHAGHERNRPQEDSMLNGHFLANYALQCKFVNSE